MTREDKINMALEKGITCDINTGKVYGVRGNELVNKVNGYISIKMKNNKKLYDLKAHQFIFYKAYGKVVDCIDHINGNKTDNRIENLRDVTQQQNQHNRTTAKGYSWNKLEKKWKAHIRLNNKGIHLGTFDKEEDAREAYLNAKEIYHII